MTLRKSGKTTGYNSQPLRYHTVMPLNWILHYMPQYHFRIKNEAAIVVTSRIQRGNFLRIDPIIVRRINLTGKKGSES